MAGRKNGCLDPDNPEHGLLIRRALIKAKACVADRSAVICRVSGCCGNKKKSYTLIFFLKPLFIFLFAFKVQSERRKMRLERNRAVREVFLSSGN